MALGKENQLQPIDAALWMTSMATESRPPPPLCPFNFKNAASRVLLNTLQLT